MNVQMINTLAIYKQLVQTQMEVTLVLVLMVILVMETFVLVCIYLSLPPFFGYKGSSLSWNLQASRSPATSCNSTDGIPRHVQAWSSA